MSRFRISVLATEVSNTIMANLNQLPVLLVNYLIPNAQAITPNQTVKVDRADG